MQKKNAYLLIVAGIVTIIYSSNLFANSSTKFTEYRLFPVAKDINIRLAPNSNLIIQGVQLSPNKSVKVLGCSNRFDTKWIGSIGKNVRSRWAKIEDLNGRQGWVFAYLLRDGQVSDPEARKKSDNFYKSLPDDFVVPCNFLERTFLMQYGAVFISKEVKVPDKSLFENKESLEQWQKQISTKGISEINRSRFLKHCSNKNLNFKLQVAAMGALENAMLESNLIRIRCDSESATRDYSQAATVWSKRIEAQFLKYQDIPRKNVKAILDLTLLEPKRFTEQIKEVLALELLNKGYCFGRNKPIMYSGAPPGTSQHNFMLAIDLHKKKVANNNSLSSSEKRKIRKILGKHGWYETVFFDELHYTYLGVKSNTNNELVNKMANYGLKKSATDRLGNRSWVPHDWQEFKCK